MLLPRAKAEKLRDLLVYALDEERRLVVACDCAGGIGPLPGDVLQVSGKIVGFCTAAVALIELVAVGAHPIMLANTLSLNLDPWGKEILQGIREAAESFPELVITGSMEKNMLVSQTGIGVVAIGLASCPELDPRPSPGQVVIAVGYPLVGASVLTDREAAVSLKTVREIRKMAGVSMIIPCGSGGAAAELKHFPGLRLDNGVNFPLEDSAGPATCVLVACQWDIAKEIKALGKPVSSIGYLEGE